MLQTLRSDEILPAVLLPSSRVEQVEGPVTLPIDGGEIRTALETVRMTTTSSTTRLAPKSPA